MIGKLRCFGAAKNPSFEAFWVYILQTKGKFLIIFLLKSR
jgi:hypothetical protein